MISNLVRRFLVLMSVGLVALVPGIDAEAAAHKAETCVWPEYSRTSGNILKDVQPGPRRCEMNLNAGRKYTYGNWEYNVTPTGNISVESFWYAGCPACTGQGYIDTSPGGANPNWRLERMWIGSFTLLPPLATWNADYLDSANNYGHYVPSSWFYPRVFPNNLCAYTQNHFFSTPYNGSFQEMSRCVRLINYR